MEESVPLGCSANESWFNYKKVLSQAKINTVLYLSTLYLDGFNKSNTLLLKGFAFNNMVSMVRFNLNIAQHQNGMKFFLTESNI